LQNWILLYVCHQFGSLQAAFGLTPGFKALTDAGLSKVASRALSCRDWSFQGLDSNTLRPYSLLPVCSSLLVKHGTPVAVPLTPLFLQSR